MKASLPYAIEIPLNTLIWINEVPEKVVPISEIIKPGMELRASVKNGRLVIETPESDRRVLYFEVPKRG